MANPRRGLRVRGRGTISTSRRVQGGRDPARTTTRTSGATRAARLALPLRSGGGGPPSRARLAPNDAQRPARVESMRHGHAAVAVHATASAVKGCGRPVPIAGAHRSRGLPNASRGASTDLAAGVLDEVRALRARSELHADCPAARCRLSSRGTPTAVPDGSTARPRHGGDPQLAKRQLTWLRGMPQRRVIACDDADALAQVLRAAGAAA